MTGDAAPGVLGGRLGARAFVVLLSVASGVAQAFGRFSYALLLPAIDRDLLDSYALAGLVGTANVASYLFGTLIVSALAERAAPAAMVRWGLAGTTVGLGWLSRADSAAGLAVGLSITGVAGAFVWLPAPGLSASVVSSARRGAAIGLAGAGIGGGIVFASGLVTVLQSRGGDESWRTVYAIEAGLAAVVLLLCVWLLRPATPRVAPVESRAGALRRVPGWWGVVVGYTAYGLSYSIYTTYLVSALEQDAGFSPRHAAAVFTVLGVALVFGGLLLGPLSDRFGRGRTLVGGYATMAVAIALVPLGVEPLPMLSAVAFGLTMTGLPAVIAAHLADVLTPREFAGAFGRCTLAFGVAQVCGPPLGGFLAERTGSFTTPFLLAAAVAGAGALASRAVLHAPAGTSATTARR